MSHDVGVDVTLEIVKDSETISTAPQSPHPGPSLDLLRYCNMKQCHHAVQQDFARAYTGEDGVKEASF